MSTRPLRRSPAPHASPPASIALLALLALLALIIGSVAAASFPRTPAEPFRVLVYSGGTHASQDSVRAGVDAVRRLGADNGFGVEATDDPDVFDDAALARFHAVVFNNAAPASSRSGGLDDGNRAALRKYIRAGGGWVGLHDAATGTDWDWYEGLVGATFDRGTPVRTGRVEVLDHAHPSTVALPDLWERTEEWHNWGTDPAGTVHTLARIRVRDGVTGLDEGTDHPWSWCRNYDGGRSWFTAGGHAPSAFQEDAFLAHLLGGIEWAAGARPGDCTATRAGAFQRTPLVTGGLTDPVDMAVAPDRRVFVARRTGEVEVVDQRTMKVSTALDLAYHPETAARSDGLIGLALDPDFAENNWLYLLGSDPTGKRLALSRFTADGDTVDPASQKRLLTLPGRRSTDSGAPASSGSLAFDREGRLYLATGDVGLPPASGAPDDLRGAILRITPQDDGSYTVPQGNLFEPGTAGTRPEIYATGMRNPYSFTVDPVGGDLLAAEAGADGTVSHLRIAGAGQVGRPYCSGGTARGAADCAPRADGTPPDTVPGSAGVMSGAVYAYEPASLYRTKFPEYFAGKLLTYDPAGRRFTTHSFQRGNQTFSDPRFGPVEAGELQSVNGVFDDMEWNRPSAAAFGPDGALYVIDSGPGSGAGGDEGAGVFRIDHVGDGRPPGAAVTADRNNGPAPLTVAFTGAGSGLPGGVPVSYAWDFDGDGGTDSTEADPSYTYRAEGQFTARLTVTGPEGTTAMAGQEITVGNTRPRISVHQPADGGLFRPGDTIPLRVDVRDDEDGSPVDCSRILVRSQVGRAGALRPLTGSRGGEPGCGGSIVMAAGGVSRSGSHSVTVRYTDKGTPNAPELTGSASLTLRTAFQEAERFTSTGGTHGGAVAGSRTEASGGRALTEIEDGDWIAFDPVSLRNIRSVTVGATASGTGGAVEFRAGSPDGPLLGSLTVPGAEDGASGDGTAGEGAVSPTAALKSPGGGVALYVVFTDPSWNSERPDLFTVDWLRFDGPDPGTARVR
ncbi:ThuA domain-containing protein [Streptomyces sp. QL37]|uniref:ThuA domain-containing protein n=1 Tax=Streptomyces sp. QL37 TaxID=2093747 RepID=UPI000CF25C1D|nr:ThuA domain-containing protein [Streptomyces sp. QL37]PPQ55862.1 sugar-binding protein [Streptomyces sp. QL37]